MLVPERRRRVLEHVRRHGSAQVSRLAADLEVSTWTVRRDLAELEREGTLQRAHGGAVVSPGQATPGVAMPPDDPTRDAAKQQIAAAAAERLADDSTIMVLGGSTTAALTPHLHDRRLTVVTNGLAIADGLKWAHDITLVVLGGYLHRDQMTLLGPMTEMAMSDLHVDMIVAGAYGIDPEAGITGHKIVQAGYHHGMLQHTDGLMVLADSSKLGRRGPTLLAGLEQVTTLITDSAAPQPMLKHLRDKGPEVVVVAAAGDQSIGR